jgi:hypothetical protein
MHVNYSNNLEGCRGMANKQLETEGHRRTSSHRDIPSIVLEYHLPQI